MKRIVGGICSLILLLLLVDFKLTAQEILLSNSYDLFDARKNPKKKPKNYNPDSDNDGVPDAEDACPNLPGSIKAKGCPDMDDDGIADFEDECPEIPGLRIFNGCPDNDEDGIPDIKDVCPFEKGPATNGGCPISNISTTKDTTTLKANIGEERFADFLSLDDKPSKSVLDFGNLSIVNPDEIPVIYIPDKTVSVISNTTETNNTQSIEIVPEIKSAVEIYVIKQTISPRDEEKLKNIISSISFVEGKSILKQESYSALDRLASMISINPSWNITFYIYAKDGRSKYGNQQLSQNRGALIISYLTEKKKINSSKINFKAYGEHENNTTHIDLMISN